jgi:beta-galactosidase/beta-glucuronidase
VWDPSDSGTQPRGKQVHKPEGARYTPSSGIWQTVWLEPVFPQHIKGLKLHTENDAIEVHPAWDMREGNHTLRVAVLERGNVIAQNEIKSTVAIGAVREATPRLRITIPNAKQWSPDSPFLYDLRVELVHNGQIVDEISSYFGLRKVSLGKDEKGFTRILLNNKPLFLFGLLDQGFWPDGLHTPPTDEAFRYDIEMTKRLGFNLARKHVKIEPERWYYWCDKLGLLVWQDMPNGDRDIGRKDPDIERTEESAKQFEKELKALIDGRGNHPCIISWVLFNEGWGQFDTKRLTQWTKDYDPSRLVINATGWADRWVGDIHSVHKYPGPMAPKPEEKRAGVLGEFGGLGFTVEGHSLQNPRNWGYRSYTNAAALTAAYLNLLDNLRPLIQTNGLSAAVYTQTSDVEIEVNGMMTYDRALLKMDEATIRKANQLLYDAALGK